MMNDASNNKERLNVLQTKVEVLETQLAQAQAEVKALISEKSIQGELLQQIMEHVPLGIGLVDGPESRFMRINACMSDLAGQKPTEMLGESILGVFPKDESRRIKAAIQGVLESGEPQHIPQVHGRPKTGQESGSWTELDYWDLDFFPMRGREPSRILVVAREVTRQVQAKQAAETERVRLHAILDNLPVGVWLSDETGKLIYANQASQNIWGEAKYLDITDFEAYRGWWLETGKRIKPHEWAVARAIEKGEVSLNEMIEIEDFKGHRKIIRNSAVPIVDENGRRAGVIALNEDVTNLFLSEQRLRDSEERYRTMFELSAVGQEEVDPITHRFLYVNDKMAEITGYSKEELLQMTTLDVTHPEDRDVDMERFARALSGEVPEHSSQKRFVRKDGSIRWVEVHAGLIRNRSNEPTRSIGVVVDITESKAAAEAVEKYIEQLARSNEDLEQFAFVASHDLQEPLRKVELFASFLLNSASDKLDSQERDYLERLHGAVERMRDMVNDLLTLSRVTTHGRPFVKVSLEDIGQNVLSDLETLIQGNQGIVEIGKLPEIEADPIQMYQLFQNLIANALKFHKPDTAPVIKIYEVTPPALSLQRLTSWRSGTNSSVQIVFEDNGIGFNPEQAEKIFQPFYRLQGRQYEGSGMGLAICRKIVERHGGSLKAESQPGEGARFIITLPRHQENTPS